MCDVQLLRFGRLFSDWSIGKFSWCDPVIEFVRLSMSRVTNNTEPKLSKTRFLVTNCVPQCDTLSLLVKWFWHVYGVWITNKTDQYVRPLNCLVRCAKKYLNTRLKRKVWTNKWKLKTKGQRHCTLGNVDKWQRQATLSKQDTCRTGTGEAYLTRVVILHAICECQAWHAL